MAKNKLSDLNDHLFMALERLNDEDMTPEKIEMEARRADAIIGISTQIVGSAKVTIDALKLVSNGSLSFKEIPQNFGLTEKNDPV
ncbi:hypothetical protein [Dysgonomonas macrotermitis]|uniref:Uncharacterized protein n=1 Tax=Dysgonomonas macrotermitis TaxID=1346286 RepID=A0A1M4UMQ9_9BACT|nr:hypothetical protein [Dysgonomonas macrotermitis]SHE58009.1 hypothetical protein SAMN05444362_101649 [Dysgonomonas macrotermitis]